MTNDNASCNKAKGTVDRASGRGRERILPFFRFQISLFSSFSSLYDHDVLRVLLNFNPSAICVERI